MRIPYDAEKRTIAIPSGGVTADSLDANLNGRKKYLNIGVYGSSKYGHAAYGANYGYYGYSTYGDSTYH